MIGRRLVVALGFALVFAPSPSSAGLTAPTNLVATAASGSAINLSWTDTSSTETLFAIERGTDGATFVQIALVAAGATSYQSSGLASGVRYYYRVRAGKSGNNYSPYSNTASAVTLDTIPPGVPSGVTAAPAGCSQVNVAWNAVGDSGGSGLAGYNVFRNGTFVRQVVAPATSVADTALTGSTYYSYSITAYDYAGNQSTPSAATGATTTACADTTPPSIPTNLAATAASCSQVNLSWTASTDTGGSGLKGYNIYRGGAFVKQVLAPAVSTSDTGLAASNVYSYTITAVDVTGNQSAQSAAKSVTTPTCGDTTPPSAPTGLSATPASCSQINLAWNASTDTGGSGLKGYNVFRNGVFVRQVLAPATSTPDTGLGGSTVYSYAVTAFDNAGNTSLLSSGASAGTPACSATTTTTTTRPPTTTTIPQDTTPPSVPTNLAATAASCTQVNLSWTGSSDSGTGMFGYWVYRNGVFLKLVLSPATSTSDTVAASSTNSYTVAAIDNSNNLSAQSLARGVTSPACADTVPPSVPTGLSASPASCSQVNLAWAASTDTGSGVKGYNIYRGGVFLKLVLAPATSTSDTGLSGSTLYSYAVSAVDNAGNTSSLSATASTNTPACPDTTAPSVPSGVAATAPSCSQANVSWNASTDSGSGVKAYNLYRGGVFLKQVTAPATSTSDTALLASTVYSYAVTAIDNANNQSALSVAAGVTTPSCSQIGPTDAVLAGYVPAVGTAKDVVLAGTNAYVASAEFGVAVVDVTTPSAPRATKGATVPFYGDRVAVSGSVAVASTRNVGLRVLDLSNPLGPQPVGYLSGSMNGVAIAGRYAYALIVVPGNPGHVDVLVIDVGVPSVPAIVGRVTVAGGSELAVSGTYVYVAAGGAGVQIVDVSAPTAPRIVATVDTPGNATSVTVTGGYAYVADGTDVAVVDVRTPTQPALRGTLATGASAIAVAGTRAYAVDGMNFKIVDVANPAAPALLYTGTGYGAQRVTASGTVAYLASANVSPSQNQGGLYVIDAATPTAPRLLTNVYGGFDSWAVAASGSYGVATGNLAGLKILDLTTLSAPRVQATLAGTYTGAAVNGQYGYVLQTVAGNPGHIDLIVLNLQTPTAPPLGRLTVAGGSQLAVAGSFVYVAQGGIGLEVVDVSSPATPRLVGSVDTPGSAMAVAVANGWAYIADQTTVQTVDVSTPSRPLLRGSVPTSATAIAVSGTRVYAVDGMQLKIIDVTNPATPALLSTTTAYGAQAVAASGTVVGLATASVTHLDASGGVYVLDAAIATSPRLVRQVMVPGTARSVQAGASLFYVGDTAAVLDVVDY